MSNEAPQVEPKHHQPIDGRYGDLVAPALAAFRGMLWVGLILIAFGLVAFLIGANQDTYDPSPAPFITGGGLLGLAVPFLTSSAIIAGLGKREPAKPTTATTSYSEFVPVAEPDQS